MKFSSFYSPFFYVLRAKPVLAPIEPPKPKLRARAIHRRLPPREKSTTRKMIEEDREFRSRPPSIKDPPVEAPLEAPVEAPLEAPLESPLEVEAPVEVPVEVEAPNVEPVEVQEMSDESIKPVKESLTMSQKVRESVEAGFSADDGAEYSGLTRGYYKVMIDLIALERHSNQSVKTQSSSYLTKIDQEGVQKNYREVISFVSEHRSFFKKKPLPDLSIDPTIKDPEWKALTTMEQRRLKKIAKRPDVSDSDKSKAKALVAAIIDGKLTASDHERMVALVQSYYANGIRKSWKKVKPDSEHPDISLRLKSLIDRVDVSDADKEKAQHLLGTIVDGYIKSADHAAATKLWFANKASKREKERRASSFDTLATSVFVVCQACENLRDLKLPHNIPREERLKMVTKLNASAQDLLKLQHKLTEEKDND